MNIVHFSTSDSQGGSARSARRIHDGLRRLGHQSNMLVGSRAGDDPDVETVHGGGVLRIADRVTEETTRRLGLQYLWYPSSRRVLGHRWVGGADAIQIYNTHGGYFSHRLLPALSRKAAIVWRLSDMWAVTGHCAYAGRCEGWRTGCGACPDLATYPPLAIDTTRLLWRLKKRVYGEARPTIVAPSRWLENIAKESPLFAGCTIHHIPNGVERTKFHQTPRSDARKKLRLPSNRPLVLFCAHGLDNNQRKGSGDAIAACNRLDGRADFDLVLAGDGGESWRDRVPQKIHTLGYLSDDALIAAAYAAADITLAPSTVENLPNSILESMACGTPVVAYDSGGIADAVHHRETGWLARTGDQEGLADGMAWLLPDEAERRRLSDNGLRLIAETFDAEREARAFADLYASLTAQKGAAS